MREHAKVVGFALAALVVIIATAALSASAVLWLTGAWGRSTPSQVASSTLTVQGEPTASPTPVPVTPTATRRPAPPPTQAPRPTATPVPTLLVFDCATATVIDRVQRSYSLNLCIHTVPARGFAYANVRISWCGRPPSSATTGSSIHLDYAGKQAVQGITVIVSCDPPLAIVVTAQSLTTDGSTTQYPLQGSATIHVT